MTLAEWAEAAEVKLPPPNDKGILCIQVGHLDQRLAVQLLNLSDWFVQSPPQNHVPSACYVWMKRRPQVLDRAPQLPKAGYVKDQARTRRAT